MGKIEPGLVAIGGYTGGNKVELYTNGHWVQQPPFPEYVIYGYSTATYDNVLYVFGEKNFSNFFESDVLKIHYYLRWNQ